MGAHVWKHANLTREHASNEKAYDERLLKKSMAICSSALTVNTDITQLTITQPDDWHLHLRDGNHLCSVLPHSAGVFKRAIIMPNLKPPVTTVSAALNYRERIVNALPPNSPFLPLMTLYLTDDTTPEEIRLARNSGAVFAIKLYPAGATTNSQAGVTDLFGKCIPALEEMIRQQLPLLVHGEVADKTVDVFDRERMVAATVTPQHLIMNRNALFQDGLQPHNYCLPVLKREIHREAIFAAVTSGSKQFFLGTDSAPHERHTKEVSCGCAGIYNAPVSIPLYTQVFEQAGALDKLEAFTSFNGPDFYGLPRNTSKITILKRSWMVPKEYRFGTSTVVPMFAGKSLNWVVV
ncbi:hypothetical protein L7F22_067462 [Adiantum nelumboides]|nr:hypothetical protein [Adiantum nelumboides]